MMRKFCILFLIVSALAVNAVPVSSQGPGIEDRLNEKIEYLEFREVDIKNVLRQLARQYNLNIVFSESVSGMITVQLQNVTLGEALDSIITINRFVYTRKGDVIKVTTATEAEQEGKQTRVFKVNNASVTQLKETMAKVLSKEGSIEADTRSNAIIVTDIPRIVNQVEEMLKLLDSTTPQVLIEAKFIEATVGTTAKLGVNWGPVNADNPMVKTTGAKRSTSAPFQARDGSESMSGIFPVTSPADTAFPNSSGNSIPWTPYGFPFATTSNFTFGTMDFSNLQMALDAISIDSDAKLISAPRIVTTDNKEARIKVGQTRRIISDKATDDTTKVTTYTYATQEVGIILLVTPHVTPDGHIQLKLNPSVSSADKVDSNGIPIIEERTASTEVILKDGQTIVIGGLIEDKKTETLNKVPLLGDIPLLGWAFKHKATNPNAQKDLLIFVTARIVNENEGKLLAYQSGMITSPSRPFKLNLREVKLK